MAFSVDLLVLNVKLVFITAGTLVWRIPKISKYPKCNVIEHLENV